MLTRQRARGALSHMRTNVQYLGACFDGPRRTLHATTQPSSDLLMDLLARDRFLIAAVAARLGSDLRRVRRHGMKAREPVVGLGQHARDEPHSQ